MTFQQIGEYIEQQKEHEEETYKVSASIQYRTAQLLINIFGVKHPKMIKFEELYKEFFKEENTEDKIVDTWKKYLYK